MDDQTDVALGWFGVGLIAGVSVCVVGMFIRQGCELRNTDVYTEVPDEPPV